MNKITLLLFFIFSFGWIFAQTVLSNGGNEYSSVNAKMSFTIGETLIGDFTKVNEGLGQGFHSHPIMYITDITILDQEIDVEIFPNPTTSLLSVQFTNFNSNEVLNLNILSINGQVVKTFALLESINTINLTELAKGNYFVQIFNYSELIYTSKLIKNE